MWRFMPARLGAALRLRALQAQNNQGDKRAVKGCLGLFPLARREKRQKSRQGKPPRAGERRPAEREQGRRGRGALAPALGSFSSIAGFAKIKTAAGLTAAPI